jgi:hypothetical protein
MMNRPNGVIPSASGTIASSRPVAITTGATVGTKSAWTQLIAATPYETGWVDVLIESGSAVSNFLVDIGIGAATETVLLPNLIGFKGNVDLMSRYGFPVRIPAGSRVSARAASGNVSAGVTLAVQLHLYPAGLAAMPPFSRVTAYGITPATCLATVVDPGGVANTKVVTQITAATTAPHKALVMAVTGMNDTARVAIGRTMTDILVGASPEQKLVEDIHNVIDISMDGPLLQTFGPYPCAIPTGSRLAVAASSSNITAGDRAWEVSLYGID